MSNYELKKLIMEVVTEEISSTVLPVVVRERKVEYHECPHCKKEIYEKHTYIEGDIMSEYTTHHSDCGGAIKFPEPDWSQVADWLKPKRIKESEDNWKRWVESMVLTVEEELMDRNETTIGVGEAYDIIKTNFRADAPSRDMFGKASREALELLRQSKKLH